MVSTKRVLMIIISFCVLLFLILTTYLNQNFSYFTEPFYKNISEFQGEKISKKKLDDFNEVLITQGEVNIEKNIISIENGIYFFNFNGINTKNYIIKLDGYEILTSGNSSFFINTLNEKQKIILSIKGIIDIDILNKEEKINNIYLYPHHYVYLNKSFNKHITKNSDMKKIKQLFFLRFYKNSILNDEKNIDEIFKKIVTGNKLEINVDENINYIVENNEEYIKIINEFKKSKFGNISGESLIKSYGKFFVNESKKSIYYKNIALKAFGELINSEEKNIKQINFIIEILDELKNTNETDYGEIKKYINYYSYLILFSNSKINEKNNIILLNDKINNIAPSDIESTLILNKIFFEYDFITGIIDSSSINKLTLENQNSQKEYYISFLDNILNIILNDDIYGIESINGLLSLYINNSIDFYFNNENNKVKNKTGISLYNKILKNTESFITKLYFEPTRDKNELLERTDKKISEIEINKIESNINNIFKYYSDYLYVLSNENSSDKIIIENLEKYLLNFKEYFLALKDKEEYQALYDKQKNALLSGNTLFNNGDEELSKEVITKYLSQFYGTYLGALEINIRNYEYCQEPIEQNLNTSNQYCYEIKNFKVGNSKLDFILSPSESYKLKSIYLNGIKLNGTYKLKNQERILEDKYKSASTEDKYKYDFTRFFVNNFNTNKIENAGDIKYSDNDDSESNYEENTVIRVFKRNQLLGEKGDFTTIKSFINIGYDNIKVEEKADGEYEIYVFDGKINKKINNDITIIGLFNGNYNFTPNHSFFNTSIKFLDEDENYLNKTNSVKITGNLKIQEIEEQLNNLFLNINNINRLTNSLSDYYFTNQIDITYNTEEDSTIYMIDTTSITLKNQNITSIKIMGQEKLFKQINLSNIKTTLDFINL